MMDIDDLRAAVNAVVPTTAGASRDEKGDGGDAYPGSREHHNEYHRWRCLRVPTNLCLARAARPDDIGEPTLDVDDRPPLPVPSFDQRLGKVRSDRITSRRTLAGDAVQGREYPADELGACGRRPARPVPLIDQCLVVRSADRDTVAAGRTRNAKQVPAGWARMGDDRPAGPVPLLTQRFRGGVIEEVADRVATGGGGAVDGTQPRDQAVRVGTRDNRPRSVPRCGWNSCRPRSNCCWSDKRRPTRRRRSSRTGSGS